MFFANKSIFAAQSIATPMSPGLHNAWIFSDCFEGLRVKPTMTGLLQ